MTIGTITSGPAPTAAEEARWAPYRATAIAQARRDHAHDWSGMAASVGTGLAVTGAAIAGAMTLPMLTVIITGSLVIAAATAVGAGAWLVDRGRDRMPPLFQAAATGVPVRGKCSCGVRLRQPASDAEAAAVAVMAAPEPAKPAAAPPVPPRSSVLDRAAKLLPPEFDPKVDSMVDGIPPLGLDGQIRDGAL